MLVIPGQPGKDLCDRQLGITRRDLLRVGGSAMLGLTLGDLLERQAAPRPRPPSAAGPGWGKAKSVIMVYLQGGPSHLDLWDPKENVPDNVRSVFKPIATKMPGVNVTEILPKLAQITDKFTFIRSMSYTPNGLFNHTAAIYQMHDRLHDRQGQPVRPARAAQPEGLSQLRLEHHPAQAADGADAAVRDAAAAAAGEQRRRQGRARPASWAGPTIPTSSIPAATTWTWPRWTGSRSTTCSCGPRSSPRRLERRAKLRDADRRGHAGDRQGRRRSTTSTSTTTRRSA